MHTCSCWVALEHAYDSFALESGSSKQKGFCFRMPPGDDWNSRVSVAPSESSDAVIRHVVGHDKHGRVAVEEICINQISLINLIT
jgi:hypothetical protein